MGGAGLPHRRVVCLVLFWKPEPEQWRLADPWLTGSLHSTTHNHTICEQWNGAGEGAVSSGTVRGRAL